MDSTRGKEFFSNGVYPFSLTRSFPSPTVIYIFNLKKPNMNLKGKNLGWDPFRKMDFGFCLQIESINRKKTSLQNV